MKLTSITITERKNLGDYQHREAVLTGLIEESESELDAIDRITKLTSWAVHYPERALEYEKQKGLLNSTDEKVKDFATKYVAKFEETQNGL